MLQLIMRHTGELFLKTPESEHQLHRQLVFTIDPSLKGENSLYAIIAMEEALLSEVLWFFDFYLEELVDREYAPEHSKFALNLMRVKFLAEIESTIKNGVTVTLANRNISHFDIIDITPNNE